ncbi:MAG TPA: tetratricopeptide repeat protein, partial [Thermoanaerobaculia bacterium]|nr:tetratricopeptide repeat protein [Thermoanaerobaculia bacterium]
MRDLEAFWKAPQEPGAVWQVALFLLPMWIEPEELEEEGPEEESKTEARLAVVWTALCLDLGSGEIAMSRIADAPEGSLAVGAMSDLARRTGNRPERIQVSDLEVAEKIRAALGTRADLSGTAEPKVELRDDLLELRSVFNAFREHIAGNDLPGYLTVREVTVERVAAFARAAAGFFTAAPWLLLGPADLVEIEAPPDLRIRLYLFGKSNPKGLLAFLSGEDVLEPELPWSLLFVPAERIPLDDLELWTRHRLPLARPGVYPFLFYPRVEEIERPDPWQLSLFEGLLRLFAGLTQEEVDRGEVEREVEIADGPVRFRLRVPGLPVGHDEVAEVDEVEEEVESEAWQRAETLLDDEPGGTRRSVLLARRALEIWPDCALAYVALGEAVQDIDAALGFFRQAVAAGRRALGAEALEAPGEIPEMAMGYLTALHALADTLHQAGRSEEAVEPLRELLRLDPLDPGKARYLLVDCLLLLRRHQDLQDLQELLWR